MALAVLLAGGAVAWAERTPLLAWFYVRGLARADEVTRDRWVERVAGLGEAAVPELLQALGSPNPAACANVQAGLTRLSAESSAGDALRVKLAVRMTRGWDAFSDAGKADAMKLLTGWFRGGKESTPALVSAATKLLGAAARGEKTEVQPHALGLCAALLPREGGVEAVSPGRNLTRTCLASADATTRVLAVRLALFPGMDLLEDVVPLLNDPNDEVRRAAVMAVGPVEQVVRDETLLPCLHDPDAEVRRLGELALRGRGLRSEHIQLGRVLTDPNPVVRLQVLDLLRRTPDLDPGIWLRRLSHDPSPAVRAAAVRAMSQQSSVDLSDRIDQMAHNDPSPTVCLLARYYLKNARPSLTAER
jgi:HEAT repeat protein